MLSLHLLVVYPSVTHPYAYRYLFIHLLSLKLTEKRRHYQDALFAKISEEKKECLQTSMVYTCMWSL